MTQYMIEKHVGTGKADPKITDKSVWVLAFRLVPSRSYFEAADDATAIAEFKLETAKSKTESFRLKRFDGGGCGAHSVLVSTVNC